MRRGQPPLSLKARALAYLAAREHSRSELRAKLLRPVRVKAPKDRKASTGGVTSKLVRFSIDEAPLDQEIDHEPVRSSEEGIDLAAEVDSVLDELESLKYLSDERFVESLRHRRAGRFGVLKLKYELKSHQIAEPLIRAAVEQARSSELEQATSAWSRKFSSLPETPDDRVKQQRFLAGRGFSPAIVYKVLKGRTADEVIDP